MSPWTIRDIMTRSSLGRHPITSAAVWYRLLQAALILAVTHSWFSGLHRLIERKRTQGTSDVFLIQVVRYGLNCPFTRSRTLAQIGDLATSIFFIWWQRRRKHLNDAVHCSGGIKIHWGQKLQGWGGQTMQAFRRPNVSSWVDLPLGCPGWASHIQSAILVEWEGPTIGGGGNGSERSSSKTKVNDRTAGR